jgi:hypothetical protein
MLRKLAIAAATGTAMLAAAPAFAHDWHGHRHFRPHRVVVLPPPPVYYVPAPAYYTPPPVAYRPPVYFAPRPVIVYRQPGLRVSLGL